MRFWGRVAGGAAARDVGPTCSQGAGEGRIAAAEERASGSPSAPLDSVSLPGLGPHRLTTTAPQ